MILIMKLYLIINKVAKKFKNPILIFLKIFKTQIYLEINLIIYKIYLLREIPCKIIIKIILNKNYFTIKINIKNNTKTMINKHLLMTHRITIIQIIKILKNLMTHNKQIITKIIWTT